MSLSVFDKREMGAMGAEFLWTGVVNRVKSCNFQHVGEKSFSKRLLTDKRYKGSERSTEQILSNRVGMLYGPGALEGCRESIRKRS